MTRNLDLILTLSCPDTAGIVPAVPGLLMQAGCHILAAPQAGGLDDEPACGSFFMPMRAAAPRPHGAATGLWSSHLRSPCHLDAMPQSLARTAQLPLHNHRADFLH